MDADVGIVLKTTPLRESDLLVVLYTSRHGRVTAVARGARRSQRRFAGALQLLVLARFQLGRRPRGEMWGLDSAEIVREWIPLATDVIAVAHASYVVELVHGLLPPEAPEPRALEIVIAAWDSLAARGPSPATLRAVELALLDLAGHRPALDGCAACGDAALDSGAVFDPARGGVICRRCAATSRGPGVRPVDAGALAYIRAVRDAADAGADVGSLDADTRFVSHDRTVARDALVAMVQALVGRPLKSLEYIGKLAASVRRS
jgi:DNA repair protein RecO (recombination protein O)